MAKVTRIAKSKNLTPSKYNRLQEIADRLGKLRAEIWQRYGSIKGTGLTHRQIRNQWLSEDRKFDVPARLWKETLRDTFSDIITYRKAAKVKVRRSIYQRAEDQEERRRLYTLLKYDTWMEDNYLRRMMRKHFQHGKTNVRNQIVLDTGCYTIFERNGVAWIDVISLKHGKRIAIPLNTNQLPFGTLRLILCEGQVEVHYAVDEEIVCNTEPCGNAIIGIDKGYTEAFVDSDGERFGEGLGDVLNQESDYLKTKYQRHNRLKAIADAKPHKRQKIIDNNLGRKKLNNRKRKHTANVRDLIFKATHSLVDKASTIVCEDLTSSNNGKSYGADQNRRLASWVKGIIAEAVESVSRRRRASVSLINGAYTSQIDSRYGILLGKRTGDRFYCFDGEVLDADINAARNVLARAQDEEISLYMPYRDVKVLLLKRTEQFQRWGLLHQSSSCMTQTNTTTNCGYQQSAKYHNFYPWITVGKKKGTE